MFLSLLYIQNTVNRTSLRSIKINGESTKRGDHEVQIGKYKWDFFDLFNRSEIYTTEFNGIHYYISYARPLISTDVPSYASLEPDTAAMACNFDTQTCWNIAFHSDFEYSLISKRNYSRGLYFIADGIPHHIVDTVDYTMYDIAHTIMCNPDKTGVDLEPSIQVFGIGDRVMFTFDWETEYGCPLELTKVPDQPDVADNLDCHFRSYMGNSTNFGLDINFTLLNGGPAGLRTMFVGNDQALLLYYQPCGWIDCPYTANRCEGGIPYGTTDNRGVASAWVCTISGTGDNMQIDVCKNYGNVCNDKEGQPDYKIEGDESDGLTHTLTYDDGTTTRTTKIPYACEQAYPDEYIEFPLIAEQFSDTALIMEIDSESVCLRNIPDAPDPIEMPTSNPRPSIFKHKKFFIHR